MLETPSIGLARVKPPDCISSVTKSKPSKKYPLLKNYPRPKPRPGPRPKSRQRQRQRGGGVDTRGEALPR